MFFAYNTIAYFVSAGLLDTSVTSFTVRHRDSLCFRVEEPIGKHVYTLNSTPSDTNLFSNIFSAASFCLNVAYDKRMLY